MPAQEETQPQSQQMQMQIPPPAYQAQNRTSTEQPVRSPSLFLSSTSLRTSMSLPLYRDPHIIQIQNKQEVRNMTNKRDVSAPLSK